MQITYVKYGCYGDNNNDYCQIAAQRIEETGSAANWICIIVGTREIIAQSLATWLWDQSKSALLPIPKTVNTTALQLRRIRRKNVNILNHSTSATNECTYQIWFERKCSLRIVMIAKTESSSADQRYFRT